MSRRGIMDGPLVGIAERARELADSDVVPTATWSLAQICQHLALSIEATSPSTRDKIGARGSAAPAGRYGPLRRWCFRRIILTFGYIPRNIPVPDGIYPTADATPETELVHLASAARAFEAAASKPDRVWPAQRYTGPLTASQWRRFHHVHAAHHFAFLALGGLAAP